jgi:hypothetical protein
VPPAHDNPRRWPVSNDDQCCIKRPPRVSQATISRAHFWGSACIKRRYRGDPDQGARAAPHAPDPAQADVPEPHSPAAGPPAPHIAAPPAKLVWTKPVVREQFGEEKRERLTELRIAEPVVA